MRRKSTRSKRDFSRKKQPSSSAAEKDSKKSQDDINRAKSAFIANISHEIRTPMNAIMGFAQMLNSTPLNETQADYVNVILESGKKLLLIINNLLDLSNLQLGKSTLNLKACQPKELFDKLVRHFEPLVTEKNLKFITECPAEIPLVMLDCEKIERVISFIISNALKYTQIGFVSVKLSSKPLSPREELLCLVISDSGIGIAPDILPHVFDVFEQGDNSITRPFGGMGIGLGLSRQIVLLLGGRISVSSTLGEGSQFKVEIPTARVQPREV